MPYPNFHACRLFDPDACMTGDENWGQMEREHDGKKYSVIRGRKKSDGEWIDQAFRYAKGAWDASEAGAHCRAHDGKFEAASESEGLTEMVHKGFVCKTEDADDAKRHIVSRISTTTVDRDMEVMLPGGMDMKGYNGMVLWSHDYGGDTLPIGRNLWVKATDSEVIAKTEFNDLPFSRDVYRLYRDGFLNSWSVGFTPQESREPTQKEVAEKSEWATVRRIHTRWQLLEYSAVKIPSNPDALTLAMSKGLKLMPELLKDLRISTKPKLIEAPRIIPAIVLDTGAMVSDMVREEIYKMRGGV